MTTQTFRRAPGGAARSARPLRATQLAAPVGVLALGTPVPRHLTTAQAGTIHRAGWQGTESSGGEGRDEVDFPRADGPGVPVAQDDSWRCPGMRQVPGVEIDVDETYAEGELQRGVLVEQSRRAPSGPDPTPERARTGTQSSGPLASEQRVA